MKYIRTKDGIYELEHDGWLTKRTKPKHVEMLVAIDNEHYEMRKIIHKKEIGKKYWKTEIINQADTIEELCDQFVFVDDFYLHEHRVCHSFENAVALSKKHNVDIKTFMGAIWTNKGLIFVARMNNEGVLELL